MPKKTDNSLTKSGVEANGGTVAKKSYALSYSKIAGDSRPKYELAESEDLTMVQYEELKSYIKFLTSTVNQLAYKVNTTLQLYK